MPEHDGKPDTGSRKRHSSSLSHSKKTVSGRLGGGRISGDRRHPSGVAPAREASAASHRSRRPRGGETAAPEPEKAVSSRRSKLKSRADSGMAPKTSPFSIKTPSFVRLLSFTGFTYTRLTKKDVWTILRRFFIGALPLIILAVAAHAVSLGSGRLWLDEKLLADGSFISSKDGVLHSWLTVFEGEYAPLPWFTMWIEHFFWGSDGSGYRVANLVLHSLSAVLVWRLGRNLNLRLSAPWLAAAVFAVHPLCFPAVGWMYARPVVMGTTFLLASLVAFSNYDKPNSDDLNPLWLLTSVLCAAAASFCHAGLALTSPFLVLGIMGFRRGTKVNTGIRHVLLCLPVILVVTPGAVISLMLAVRSPSNPFSLSWLEQIKTGAWLVFRLPLDTVWPSISFFLPPFKPESAVMGALPLASLGLSLVIFFFLRRTTVFRPLFFLVWSWTVILFGVTMYLPRNAGFNYGLTGAYLAYPGMVVLAIALVGVTAWLFSLAGEIKGAIGANLTGLTLVGLFALSALPRGAIVTNSEAFWRQVVKTYPDLPVGNEFLARELMGEKRYEEALLHLRRAMELAPGNARVRTMLGRSLLILGDVEEAAVHLRAAFKMDPGARGDDVEEELLKHQEAIGNKVEGLPEFLNISALPGHGKRDILEYDQVAFTTNETSFGPDIFQAFNLVKAGKMEDAAGIIHALIQKDPRGAMGHYLAGYMAFENQAFDDAVDHLRLALTSQPDLAGASFFLGVALREKKQYGEAVRMLSRAVRLRPKMADAYYQMGVTYEAMNARKSALDSYAAAVLAKQDHVPALRACAEILAVSPDPALRNGKQALELAQKAVLHAPESDAELLMTLAAAYAEAGYFSDAVRTARRAVQKAATGEREREARKRLEAFQSGKRYHQTL
ncbi:MAG: tetratricopeptide repeat protein [Lentisphaeria bacterium]|nr:tetratricopeptide repeat protein [Lentisphaeria bacterium]